MQKAQKAQKVRKVVLVGPRAAGKTTLGKALATDLGWTFRDTDDLVAVATGQPAADYLRVAGEVAFRRVEEAVVPVALVADRQEVLALGGGAVVSAAVRDALRKPRHPLLVVLLRAPVPVLVSRQEAVPRPPLTSRPLRDEIAQLLAERWGYYVAVSHMQLDTSSANVDACRRSIMDKIGLSS